MVELAPTSRRCAKPTHSSGVILTKTSVALIFVLAPLPNALFAHCGGDDFTTDYEGSGPVDLGRFLTSIVVVTGFALPLVLAHSEIIRPGACAMSIIGGSCVIQSPLLITHPTESLQIDSSTELSWHTALLSSKRTQNSIEMT